jgi:pyrroloquinoline quinone biosynthesis protein B
MRITVLGSGANGGVPQWDCCCPNCARARADPRLRRTRSSVAVSPDGGQQVLIDAGPDLKFQLEAAGLTPRPKEAGGTFRQSRIEAVLLTHGHGDHTVGIAEFSTGKSFSIPVYAPPDLVRFLFGSEGGSYFGDLGRLSRDYVKPIPLPEGEKVRLLGGMSVEGFRIEHTDRLGDGSYFPSSTYGYEIEAEGKCFIYTPDLGRLTEGLLERVEGADLFILDATFWWDDELGRVSGLNKTSYELGHVPAEESLDVLKGVEVGRVVYTHLNHTNPMLDPDQGMAERVRGAGLEIAHDGMIIRI